MTPAGEQTRVSVVGRSRELSFLADEFAQAAHGSGRVVSISAGPGLGKTALVETFVAGAHVTTLRCHGIEAEVELPFSGLHQLLLPVSSFLGNLERDQRAALEEAVTLQPGRKVSTIDAALGTLSVIAELAARGPVLVVVDDAHWIDAATARVLAFVARRIAHHPVLMLVATRPTEQPLPFEGRTLTLGPLDPADTRSLAGAVAGRPLLTSATDAVYRATGGNPLAIVATITSSRDKLDQLGTLLDEPPPVDELIKRNLAERIARLSESCRRALAVAATSILDDAGTIDRAITSLGLAAETLDEAEDAGVVLRHVGTITFTHPLLRSVVYHDITATQHRAIHRALADAADDASLRAWHAGAAARGTDDALADDLAAAADDFISRGGHLAGARALERAARLTADREVRAQRLLDAALSAREASRNQWAARLYDEAEAASADPRRQITVRSHRLHLDLWAGEELPGDVNPFTRIAEDALEVDRDLGLNLLAVGANRQVIGGYRDDAVDIVQRIRDLGPADDAATRTRTEMVDGIVSVLSGSDPVRGRGLLVSVARDLMERGEVIDADVLADALLWVEEYDLAAQLVTTALDKSRAIGSVRRESAVLSLDGYRRFRIGDWAGATSTLREAADLSEAAGERYQLALSVVTRALLEGCRGNDATELLDRASQLIERHRFVDMRPHLLCARGAFDLAQGRGAAALVHLEAMEAWCAAGGYVEPSVFPWQADLVEAYLLVGRTADARAALERLRARSAPTQRIWPAATIARLEGILATDAGYAEAFERAIALFGAIPATFELAQSHLRFGERLRRSARGVAAGEHLRRAETLFAQLEAPAWIERTRTALRGVPTAASSAAHVAAKAEAAGVHLTGQERAVAELVAEGLTNKEIAARLFLTVKTIEWHLRQIYRKLEIKSRVQLAAYVNGVGTESSAGSATAGTDR